MRGPLAAIKTKQEMLLIDYINELLNYCKDLYNLRNNDFEQFLKLKSKLLNYVDLLDKYHLYNIYLTKYDIQFLNTGIVDDFCYDISKLFLIYVKVNPIENQFLIWFPRELQSYYTFRFRLLRFNFYRKYWHNINLLKCDGNVDFSMLSQLENKKELVTIINETKEQYSQYKIIHKLKKESITIKERNAISNVLKQVIDNYKNTIEQDFFEIKHHFRYYYKLFKVYVIGFPRNTMFQIVIGLYKSNQLRYEIYPNKINVHSIGCNVEEIIEEGEIYLNTVSYKIPVLDSCFLLSIDKNEPYIELFEYAWNKAENKSKFNLAIKAFELLGFNITCIDYINCSFNLQRCEFVLDNDGLHKVLKPNAISIVNEKKNFNESIDQQIKKISVKIELSDRISIYYSYDNANKMKLLGVRNLAKIILESSRYSEIQMDLISIAKDNTIREPQIINSNLGRNFLDKLNAIVDYNLTWHEFEIFIAQIFEYLFKESFKHYYAKAQAEEYDGLRRIDLLIHNTNPINDFWKTRKLEQKAKRIVVEFKNYSQEISGNIIDETAKYLNSKAGNFAIIVSKYGINSSGKKRQKHLYIIEDKLILDLQICDLKEMINYKLNNSYPEEILDRKIGELIIN